MTYVYADGVSGNAAKYVRLAEVKYPGATAGSAFYHYADADPSTVQEQIADAFSRVYCLSSTNIDSLADANTYARYTYTGQGLLTKVEHPAVTGGLNLDYGVAGTSGLDKFGRVIDQKWTT